MSTQQHAPSFVHATVHLRQSEPDPASSIALWKSLFERWEEIFSFLSKDHHQQQQDDNNNYNNNINHRTRKTTTNDEGEDDDEDRDMIYSSNNNDDDEYEYEYEERGGISNEHDDSNYYYSPPPPPGAILMRLLFCSGTVVPGTLPQSCPQFDVASTQSSQNSTASSHYEFLNPHNGSLSNNFHNNTDSNSFFKVYQKIRQDHASAALAYAEWWRWVLSSSGGGVGAGDLNNSTSDGKTMMMSSGRSKASLFSSPTNPVAQQQQLKSLPSSSLSPVSLTTAKFLFAASVKIGSLLQFVSVTGLQAITNCTQMNATTAARAQASLLATISQLPSSCPPLPPPYLLSHLAGLQGATGEAFMDASVDHHHGNQNTAAAAAVDFFSFTVTKAVSSSIKHEREVCLELKFLDVQNDEIVFDTEGEEKIDQDNNNNLINRIRTREVKNLDAENKILNKVVTNSSHQKHHHQNNNNQHQQQQKQYQLFTPRWSYGCVRFTAIPTFVRAQNNAFATAMTMNTASIMSNLTSSAVHSSTLLKQQPMAGSLRAPQYEEVFGIRYVISLAQRLMSTSSGVGNTSSSSSSSMMMIRLAGRLSFWASTAAASFPMESLMMMSSTSRGVGAGSSGNFSGRRGRTLQQQIGNNNNNNVKNNSSSYLLSLDGLSELVLIPCMSACLSMFCAIKSLQLPNTSSSSSSSSNSSNGSSVIIEALLSVALAYAACTYAANNASFGGGAAASQNSNSLNLSSSEKSIDSNHHHQQQHETTIRRAREEAIANLMKQTQQFETNTKKTKNDSITTRKQGKKSNRVEQQQKQDASASKSENENGNDETSAARFSSSFFAYEAEISSWRAMNAGQRSALTLRHLLMSMTTQWIACLPTPLLEKELLGTSSISSMARSSASSSSSSSATTTAAAISSILSSNAVFSSLPSELKTVLEFKFNPHNKKLLSMMMLSGGSGEENGDDDAKNAGSPKVRNIISMKLKPKMMNPRNSNNDGTRTNEEDDAERALLDVDQEEEDEEELRQSSSETQLQLLMLWAELENYANESIS